jgi:hypothetical protein
MSNDQTSSTDYLVFARYTTSASPESRGSSAGASVEPLVIHGPAVIELRPEHLVVEYVDDDGDPHDV